MDPLSDIKSFLAMKPDDRDFGYFISNLYFAYGTYLYASHFVDDKLHITKRFFKPREPYNFENYPVSYKIEDATADELISAISGKYPEIARAIIFRIHLFN